MKAESDVATAAPDLLQICSESAPNATSTLRDQASSMHAPSAP